MASRYTFEEITALSQGHGSPYLAALTKVPSVEVVVFSSGPSTAAYGLPVGYQTDRFGGTGLVYARLGFYNKVELHGIYPDRRTTTVQYCLHLSRGPTFTWNPPFSHLERDMLGEQLISSLIVYYILAGGKIPFFQETEVVSLGALKSACEAIESATGDAQSRTQRRHEPSARMGLQSGIQWGDGASAAMGFQSETQRGHGAVATTVHQNEPPSGHGGRTSASVENQTPIKQEVLDDDPLEQQRSSFDRAVGQEPRDRNTAMEQLPGVRQSPRDQEARGRDSAMEQESRGRDSAMDQEARGQEARGRNSAAEPEIRSPNTAAEQEATRRNSTVEQESRGRKRPCTTSRVRLSLPTNLP